MCGVHLTLLSRGHLPTHPTPHYVTNWHGYGDLGATLPQLMSPECLVLGCLDVTKNPCRVCITLSARLLCLHPGHFPFLSLHEPTASSPLYLGLVCLGVVYDLSVQLRTHLVRYILTRRGWVWPGAADSLCPLMSTHSMSSIIWMMCGSQESAG